MTEKILNIITYIVQTFASLISKPSSEENKHPTASSVSGNNCTTSGNHNRHKISHSNVAGGDLNIFSLDKNDDSKTMTFLIFGLLYFMVAVIFVLIVLIIFF